MDCFVLWVFFYFSVLKQYQVVVEFIEFSGFYASPFITFSFAEPFFGVWLQPSLTAKAQYKLTACCKLQSGCCQVRGRIF